MRIVLNRTLVHRCPYKDEIDVGAITMIFDGPSAPELYEVAAYLDAVGQRAITHEALTAEIAEHFSDLANLSVSTAWMTAGIEVEVTAP